MNVHFVFETKAGRVTDWRLPGATFECWRAYDEFAPERRAYEAAVAAYAAGEVAECELRDALEALPGLMPDDVEWHVGNPGRRQSDHFIAL